MEPITIDEIEMQLKRLSPTKLAIVYDFVAFLASRDQGMEASSMQTMLASEESLAKDWNRPEEDEAWAHL